MRVSRIQTVVLVLISLSLSACSKHSVERRHKVSKITTTTPQSKAVTLTQQYVCQIRAQRHINFRAFENGFLDAVRIKEGQTVRQDDLLFQVIPMTYKAKLERTAQPAASGLNLAHFKSPFDGIVDRMHYQQGDSVQQGKTIATLSDNSLMWVYFNVPEARYLEYMAGLSRHKDDLKVELMLANGNKFDQIGKMGTIEADFNNVTGTVPFRADFANPDRLLRHGQTGTVLISRVQNDALVIPQRAVFEVLDKRYVYVVDKDDLVHWREIVVQNEVDDIFVIKGGLGMNDKIVLDGVRQLRDGDKVDDEGRQPDQVVARPHDHAE